MMTISAGRSTGDGGLGKPAMMTLTTLSVAEHLDSVARLDTDESAKHRR
jgi:CO dehydrogenase nickel-insertion accessory protein CooC1